MINRKFINFKTYSGFLVKKNEIPEDSIVFIQDRQCIWARGKEYICDGPSTASVERNTLTFKNGNDKMIFKFQQKDGTITIEDSEGNKGSATYVLKDIYDGTVTNIYNAIANIQEIAEGYVLESELADVAFSGSYNDLIDTPDSITIDTLLSSISENPVLNKAIYNELKNKADSSSLSNYVGKDTYDGDMLKKQDKLTADWGIDIFKDNVSKQTKIRSTLDTNVYEFVTVLPEKSTASPNKIYILEVNNGDGTYRYELYRLRNGEWVSFNMVLPEIDLHEYLKIEDAELTYQPIIDDYLTSNALKPYAKIEEDIKPILAMFSNYALKDYVDDNFQKIGDYATKDWVTTYFVLKLLVYFPKQGDWGTDTPSEGEGTSNPSIPIQIIVDKDLSLSSSNPVRNSTVTLAIKKLQDEKADASSLANYAKNSDLASKVGRDELGDYLTALDIAGLIEGKQDILTAGYGISIINNKISSTLDTEVYIFVKDRLPSTGISSNKIYILETIVDDEREYSQWRWDDDLNDWVRIGGVTPEIDLRDYLTIEQAGKTYALKGNYATQQQLLKLKEDAYNDLQIKGNYATVDYIDGLLEGAGYLTSTDLIPYAFSQDLLDLEDAVILNYATKQELINLKDFVDETYVKLALVYTPKNTWEVDSSSQPDTTSDSNTSNTGGGTTIIYNVEVDQDLSNVSNNPVANWRVTGELNKKLELAALADYAKTTELNKKASILFVTDNYVSKGDFTTALNGKQDLLIEGNGISIDDDNVISVTLDTDIFVIVDGDLPTTNINENKIYLQEATVDGQTTYKEWRRRNDTWIEVGLKDLSVDLSGYLTEQQSDLKYLISEGTYLTPLLAEQTYQQLPETSRFILESEVETGYQPKGDYALATTLNVFRDTVEATYQKKGEYVLASEVADKLVALQKVIDQKYVLKKDVYKPEQDTSWSTAEITPIPVNSYSGSAGTGGGSSSGDSGSGSSVMITLTTTQYQSLVDAGQVQDDVYYFTYEESEDWTFGDPFPITLS